MIHELTCLSLLEVIYPVHDSVGEGKPGKFKLFGRSIVYLLQLLIERNEINFDCHFITSKNLIKTGPLDHC